MKKKIIPLLLALAIACSFALAGCGGSSLSSVKVEGRQDTSYKVQSNGGSAVWYGNYVYFINGTSGYDDTEGTANSWKGVVKGGLYRAELCGTKTDADTGADFDVAANKSESVVDKSLEFVTSGTEVVEYAKEKDVVSVQLIAPKRIGTSGYSAGGIFIYDEWLYFASPNNEKNKAGSVQYAKTDFFRMKLDGTNVQRVYTTSNDATDSPYVFTKYNGAVYLVAQDGTDVISLRLDKKVGDKVTIATGVTKVVLPYSRTYYAGMDENTLDHFVYVQRPVGDGDTQKSGNVIEIMRPDGTGGGTYRATGSSDTIEDVRDGMLFYRTTADSGNTLINYDNLHNFLMGNEDGERVYGDDAYRAAQKKLAEENSPLARVQMGGTILSTSSASDYTSTYCFRPGGEQSNLVYMLGMKSGNVELRSSIALTSNNESANGKTIVVYNSGATFVNLAGEYMYFTESGSDVIYRTAWLKAASEKSDDELREQVSGDDVTASGFNGDYCAGYVVYFGKADEWADGYAMFKLVERVEGQEAVFVGKKLDSDLKPEETEEDEDTESTDEE